MLKYCKLKQLWHLKAHNYHYNSLLLLERVILQLVTNAHHRGLLKKLQGQGDFSSVFMSHAGRSRTFPNGNNFISYFKSSAQVYYKKPLVQTEAGTTLIEPKYHFTYPASCNNTHACVQPDAPIAAPTNCRWPRQTHLCVLLRWLCDLRFKNLTDCRLCSPLTVINT